MLTRGSLRQAHATFRIRPPGGGWVKEPAQHCSWGDPNPEKTAARASVHNGRDVRVYVYVYYTRMYYIIEVFVRCSYSFSYFFPFRIIIFSFIHLLWLEMREHVCCRTHTYIMRVCVFVCTYINVSIYLFIYLYIRASYTHTRTFLDLLRRPLSSGTRGG